MKKFKFLSLLAILMLGMTFTSCGDDDDPQDEQSTLAEQYAGSYKGTDKLNIDKAYDVDGQPVYIIKANKDNTIDVTVPEETIKESIMGTITVGTYTVKGLKWDDAKSAFTRNYKNDGITFHFTTVNHGKTIFDKEYTMGVDAKGEIITKDVCNISVKKAADGTLTITNSYQMSSMPFLITNNFTATK